MTQTTADFNLHGLLRLRAMDALPSDLALLTASLAPFQEAPAGDPDLLIRFVDRLDLSGVCFVDGETAFTESGYFRLERPRSGGQGLIPGRIDFGDGEGPVEMVCERGARRIPMLETVLDLLLLRRGVLPFHGAAFQYQGVGAAVTGMSHSCKTGTLLAFMARGATFLADDRVYLGPGGERMCALPERVSVKERYLRDLPHFLERLTPRERARLSWVSGLKSGVAALPPLPPLRPVWSRLAAALERRASVSLPPERLFGAKSCAPEGPLHQVFLMINHDAPEIRVEREDPVRTARRLAHAQRSEWLHLAEVRARYGFAFPDTPAPLLEEAEARQEALLHAALTGRETYRVLHPYPVAPQRLFEALSSCFAG